MGVEELVGVLAIGITVISYGIYIYGVVNGKTEPHIFTWFIWGCLLTIAFLIQLEAGGALGAWLTGLSALLTYVIFIMSFKYGDHNITISDKIVFLAAIMSLLLWLVIDSPLGAMIVLIIANFFGSIPTYRKTWINPYQENLTYFILAATKLLLSIATLGVINLVTALYPFMLFLNALIIIIIIIVGRYLKSSSSLRINHEDVI